MNSIEQENIEVASSLYAFFKRVLTNRKNELTLLKKSIDSIFTYTNTTTTCSRVPKICVPSMYMSISSFNSSVIVEVKSKTIATFYSGSIDNFSFISDNPEEASFFLSVMVKLRKKLENQISEQKRMQEEEEKNMEVNSIMKILRDATI